MDAIDRMAIHELLSLYGHIIDEREWTRLDLLFSPEVVCDFRDSAAGRIFHSLEELHAFWSSGEGDLAHPLAHHCTNVVVVRENPDGTAQVISKGIGVGKGGRVGSVTYEDLVGRTPAGWRILRRTAALRRAASILRESERT